MSSLYRRRLKSGEVWYAGVRLRSGRWRYFNTGATSKRAAREVVRAAEEEIAAGRDPFRRGAAGRGLAEQAETYIKACTERGLRRATLRSYRLTVSKLLSFFGDCAVDALDAEAVGGFRESLKSLTVGGRNVHLRNLKAFLKWAGQVVRIPLARTDPAPTLDYYSAEECARLLAVDSITVCGVPFGLFVAVLMFSGLRKGEAGALQWGSGPWPWIDLSGSQIIVPGAAAKARKPRYVPILPELTAVLSEWPLPKRGRLFPFAVDSGMVTDLWDRTCREAGVRRLRLHNLRDTFAVHLLLKGVPWAVVGEILGHASVETTRCYYAAIGPAELRSAVQGLHFLAALQPTDRKLLFHVKRSADS